MKAYIDCFRRLFVTLAAMGLIALTQAGCDDYFADNIDHDPAPGMGSLVVDNNTMSSIKVFVDGAPTGQVGDGSCRAYDLVPGVHRVVLEEHHGDRNFSDYVDILGNQLTILDVEADLLSTTEYNVQIRYD